MNSVNVTTSILREDLRKKMLARLDASIELLSSQETDLADFFANDERAQHLVPFLKQLSKQTGEMVNDFDKLLSNIGHVNDVVASQQSFAMKGTFTVKVDPVSVIESAIQITAEQFQELGINIRTSFKYTTNESFRFRLTNSTASCKST